MSEFTNPLIVSPQGKYGKFWKLKEGLEYHVGTEESKEVIYVPAGFITDFASTQIPRLLIPNCATIHDYLYSKQIYSRKRSDEIFMESMQVLQVNFIIRWTFYVGVRLFGFIPWWRHGRRKKR